MLQIEKAIKNPRLFWLWVNSNKPLINCLKTRNIFKLITALIASRTSFIVYVNMWQKYSVWKPGFLCSVSSKRISFDNTTLIIRSQEGSYRGLVVRWSKRYCQKWRFQTHIKNLVFVNFIFLSLNVKPCADLSFTILFWSFPSIWAVQRLSVYLSIHTSFLEWPSYTNCFISVEFIGKLCSSVLLIRLLCDCVISLIKVETFIIKVERFMKMVKHMNVNQLNGPKSKWKNKYLA